MKARRQSLYINTQGPDKGAIKEGLSWLISICASTSQKVDALLAVPLKSNILNGTIPEVMGTRIVNALAKGQKVKLEGSLGELSLLTERENIYSWDGPVLAIYPNKKLGNYPLTTRGFYDIIRV